MKKLLYLCMAVLLVAGHAAMAVTVDVKNPGFEAPVITGSWQSGGILHWSGGGGDYGLLPSPGGNPGQYCYMNGGAFIEQPMVDLSGTALTVGETMSATVSFDTNNASFTVWAQLYSVTSNQVVASGSVVTTGGWARETVTIDVTDNAIAVGEEVKLLIYNEAGQLWIDNVAVEYESGVVRANAPVPYVGELVDIDLALLEWSEPSYAGATYDVYFGATEPNALLANYGLTVLDTGTSALSADPSPAGDLAEGTTYYWIVDTYEPNAPGPDVLHPGFAWSFKTKEYWPAEARVIKPVGGVLEAGSTSYSTIETSINGYGLYDQAAGIDYQGTLVTGADIPDPVTPHVVWGNWNWVEGYRVFATGAELVYDLGALFQVDGSLFWNSGENSDASQNIAQLTMSFSTDGITFGNPITLNPEIITLGSGSYPGEAFIFDAPVQATHVKLSDIVNNGHASDWAVINEIRFAGSVLSPLVTTHPVSQTVAAGTDVTLSVEADNVTTYQWYEETAGLLTDETNPELLLSNVQLAAEGSYYCVVGNGNPIADVTSNSARVLTERLMAHWDFDGDLIDEVAGNIGTVAGNETYDAGIIGSNAFSFDSVTMITAADPDYFNFFDAGLTVSVWIKVDAAQGYGNYLHKDGAYWMNTGSDMNAFCSTGSGAIGSAGTGADALADLGWHLTTMTYDAATTMFKYYFDGQYQGQFETTPLPTDYDALLSLGNYQYVGLMDDLKVYNNPRTLKQIAEDYVAGVPTAYRCIDAVALRFDSNGDCEITLVDLAAFSLDWLNCSRVAGAASGLTSCP